MSHSLRTIFLTCLAAAAGVPAHADTITILFNNPIFTVMPGQTGVAVLATLSNLDPANTVYMNADNLSIPGAVNVNDEFFTNVPLALAPGETSPVTELFRFDVSANAVPGIFTGSYELLGGAGSAAQFNLDSLGQQPFQVQVRVVPEPSSPLLLASGLLVLLLWRRHSARRIPDSGLRCDN